MKLVFVFDVHSLPEDGNALPFRVPTFCARILCRLRPLWDYWETADGYLPNLTNETETKS